MIFGPRPTKMSCYLSGFINRNLHVLKEMCVRLSFIKNRSNAKVNRCFTKGSCSRITFVPCLSLFFSTVANCSPTKEDRDSKHIKIIEPKTLTHEYLIKQACNLNVDAATQLLTLTVSAILDLSKDYRETLQQLITLTEESLQTISMSTYQEDLWDQIIESRSQVEDLKKSLLELTSFMEYVEKVATSAAEVSYLSGADYTSTAMCERINSAQQQLLAEYQKTKQLEEELLITQESYVEKATSYSRDTDSNTRTQQSQQDSQINSKEELV